MTDAFFKNLEIQKKEMGQAFWACPSCISFASTFGAKVNQKLKEVNDRVDALQEKVDNNTIGLGEVQERVDTVEETVQKAEKAVEKVEKTVTDMAKELEIGMYQEMRAREAIKRNLVIYGVKEPDQRLTDSKDKMEADKDECEKIFIATGSKARKSDIRFCRRLGEKGEDKERPVLLGMKSETIKCEVLDQAKELRNTVYKDVGIGPDQTRKQKQAEIELKEEADRKNRDKLTDEDRSKNLKWMVVGQRGEKRLVKVEERESNREWRTQPTRGGRGRGRGRGGHNLDRTKRVRPEDEMEEEERPRARAKQ